MWFCAGLELEWGLGIELKVWRRKRRRRRRRRG
jgi:hypothetical protein